MNNIKGFLSLASGAAMLAVFFAFPGTVSALDTVSIVNAYSFPKEPFQNQVAIKFSAGKKEGFGNFKVPTTKNLVIEHVSARIALPGGQKLIEARITTRHSGSVVPVEHYLSTNFEGSTNGSDFFSISNSLRLYAINTYSVDFAFFRTDSTATGNVYATVSGYLVDK
jgi:hypothetical protein